jgi:hypothetical protein
VATISSAQSGKWSLTTTWVGGVVPVNLDTVIVASDHTVEFDVDQSAFANGLAALTITGNLSASLSPGTYYLKMLGHVAGTGNLIAGSEASPYPSTCKFTIFLNGAYRTNLTGVGSYQVWCDPPVVGHVVLTAPEAAGQTELSIDTDLRAYSDHWKAGAIVRINNVDKGLDTEERIILTAGLTNAKIAGAVIILCTRNVTIMGTAAGGNYGIYNANTGSLNIEIYKCQYGCITVTNLNLYGVMHGCTNGGTSFINCLVYAYITGCSTGGIASVAYSTVYSMIAGCRYGLISGKSTPWIMAGTICGSEEAFSAVQRIIFSGLAYGNRGVFWDSIVTLLSTATIRDFLYLTVNAAGGAGNLRPYVVGVGCYIEEPLEYEMSAVSIYSLEFPCAVTIKDFNGIDGEFRSWQLGGTIINTTEQFPVGQTRSYKISIKNL